MSDDQSIVKYCGGAYLRHTSFPLLETMHTSSTLQFPSSINVSIAVCSHHRSFLRYCSGMAHWIQFTRIERRGSFLPSMLNVCFVFRLCVLCCSGLRLPRTPPIIHSHYKKKIPFFLTLVLDCVINPSLSWFQNRSTLEWARGLECRSRFSCS